MSNSLAKNLQKMAHLLGSDPADDGELLSRYLSNRDESAFNSLVYRHGPMVFGICKRITGNATDADDAFQAAFIVLMRKAQSLTSRPTIAGFLHQVAYHTALKARAMAAKRKNKEAQKNQITSTSENDETLKILDEELAKLPEEYREPVVLCELEGMARKDAAEKLAIPMGTISSRLDTAHKMLAKRLKARGISTVTLGALGTFLTGQVVAISDELVSATFAAVSTTSTTPTTLLATEVMKMLFLKKFKVGIFAALILTLGTGIGGVMIANGYEKNSLKMEQKENSAPKQESSPAQVPRIYSGPNEVKQENKKEDNVDRSHTDYKNLQGYWKATYYEYGRNKANDRLLEQSQIKIEGDKIEFWGDQTDTQTFFDLDPSVNPKQMNFLNSNPYAVKQRNAIYELNGDTLKICKALAYSGKRPSEFTTKGDAFSEYYIFKRVEKKDTYFDNAEELAVRDQWVVVEKKQKGYVTPDTEKRDIEAGLHRIWITGKNIYSHQNSFEPMNYKLNAKNSPKQMEMHGDGITVTNAIYEVNGDEMKICFETSPKKGIKSYVPKSFDLDKQNPGEFPTLFILKRVKPPVNASKAVKINSQKLSAVFRRDYQDNTFNDYKLLERSLFHPKTKVQSYSECTVLPASSSKHLESILSGVTFPTDGMQFPMRNEIEVEYWVLSGTYNPKSVDQTTKDKFDFIVESRKTGQKDSIDVYDQEELAKALARYIKMPVNCKNVANISERLAYRVNTNFDDEPNSPSMVDIDRIMDGFCKQTGLTAKKEVKKFEIYTIGISCDTIWNKITLDRVQFDEKTALVSRAGKAQHNQVIQKLFRLGQESNVSFIYQHDGKRIYPYKFGVGSVTSVPLQVVTEKGNYVVGLTLRNFLSTKIPNSEIAGEPNVLNLVVPDWLTFNQYVEPENFMTLTQAVFVNELKLPWTHKFVDSEREVYVVKGKLNQQKPNFKYSALNGDFVPRNDNGSLSKLCHELSLISGQRIISEADEQGITWNLENKVTTTNKFNEFENPEVILNSLSQQTGLTFTKEKRFSRSVTLEAVTPSWMMDFQKKYMLRSDEHIKHLSTDKSDLRSKYLRANGLYEQQSGSVYFSFNGKSLDILASHKNSSLETVLTKFLPLHQIKCSPELLKIEIPGDFAIRSGSKPTDIFPTLEKIIQDELKQPIKFKLDITEQEAYVARGQLEDPANYKLQDKHVNIPYSFAFPQKRPSDEERLEQIKKPESLDKFLKELSEYTGVIIVNEVKQPDSLKLLWSKEGSRNDSRGIQKENSKITEEEKKIAREKIFESISRQTGLTFTLEKTKTIFLTVEKTN